MRNYILFAAFVAGLGCNSAGPGQPLDLGTDLEGDAQNNSDADGELLSIEIGDDFIAHSPGECVWFGPDNDPGSKVDYFWQMTEWPDQSVIADDFNRGNGQSSSRCGCECPAGTNRQIRACFVPDDPGIYTFSAQAQTDKEQVSGEIQVLVPPVLYLELIWPPMADLNLHLRKQGSDWGSDGDASWHNLLQGVPDWGETRPPSGKECDPSNPCFCNQGRAAGWCLHGDQGYRCEELADDPIYYVDDTRGTIDHGERILIIRPAAGVYEIGIENTGEAPWTAQVFALFLGDVSFEWRGTISPSAEEEPVTPVGLVNLPQGEETWWAQGRFEPLD